MTDGKIWLTRMNDDKILKVMAIFVILIGVMLLIQSVRFDPEAFRETLTLLSN